MRTNLKSTAYFIILFTVVYFLFWIYIGVAMFIFFRKVYQWIKRRVKRTMFVFS